ncbi:hypothetical protein H0H81_005467 [Sphagnurus paluster]|uniref:PEP5/VPS11 N-terminal domain-containing protein n=1 Tax=Sphagnurus paluster TaxID=117069 RepID=A0A9P7KHY2_9AGAR|nr:hypothetical protein H0H81_005467 [Sphagnurus paluster]
MSMGRTAVARQRWLMRLGVGMGVRQWVDAQVIWSPQRTRGSFFVVQRDADRAMLMSDLGTKSSIQSHLNYLVIVSPPFFASAASASATVRNFATRTPNYGESDIAKVIVFEPGNKYIAYSGMFTNDMREVILQWGQIYPDERQEC